jgi:hypothetical protein
MRSTRQQPEAGTRDEMHFRCYGIIRIAESGLRYGEIRRLTFVTNLRTDAKNQVYGEICSERVANEGEV